MHLTASSRYVSVKQKEVSFLAAGLASAEVYAQRAEILGAARLGSVREDVGAPGDLKTDETGHDHCGR